MSSQRCVLCTLLVDVSLLQTFHAALSCSAALLRLAFVPKTPMRRDLQRTPHGTGEFAARTTGCRILVAPRHTMPFEESDLSLMDAAKT